MSETSLEVLGLFPIAVSRCQLGRDFSKSELQFVESKSLRPNDGNSSSEDTDVLSAVEMLELKNFIEKNLNKYFKIIHDPMHDVRLRITQSWLNVTLPNQYHHQHEHPNSFISGVLYISADREKDKIQFTRNQYQQIYVTPNNYNLFNSGTWWIDVGAGDLVLFPSSLSHSVPKITEGTRVSLSFNTFPVGTMGQSSRLNHLDLFDSKEK